MQYTSVFCVKRNLKICEHSARINRMIVEKHIVVNFVKKYLYIERVIVDIEKSPFAHFTHKLRAKMPN
jgi:hypothetical protein